MRLLITPSIYIETDLVESANAENQSIRMISGIEYGVARDIFQAVIDAMKNKDSISNVVAY